jgi:hypothetical protein
MLKQIVLFWLLNVTFANPGGLYNRMDNDVETQIIEFVSEHQLYNCFSQKGYRELRLKCWTEQKGLMDVIIRVERIEKSMEIAYI